MATTKERGEATGRETPEEDRRLYEPLIPSGHPLYPVALGIALPAILMGAAGHHLAEDMDEDDTHPFFPDHFWPYPVIIVMQIALVAFMAWALKHNYALQPPANPRIPWYPRPDWYFLFLYQFLKLGNEVLFAVIIPTVWIVLLLFWPFIDQLAGPHVARLLRMDKWEVPGHNILTGGLGWFVLAGLFLLTMWSLSGVSLFGVFNG